MRDLFADDDPRAQIRTLTALHEGVEHCRSCPLWEHATHGVAGEGRAHAEVFFIGEQPGDQEDLAGKPFVGPAGRLLDDALVEAGIDRTSVFVTNAVKHFKWEARGKRRLHKTPVQREIAACHAWLEAELAIVKPRVIVCLGATAAKAMLGKDFRVTVDRGRLLRHGASVIFATIHPSAILRMTDRDEQATERARFVEDLRLVHQALKS